MKYTVSRESAPSAANLDSPVTAESSGSANCFLTISDTFFTVSGLAWTKIKIQVHAGYIILNITNVKVHATLELHSIFVLVFPNSKHTIN